MPCFPKSLPGRTRTDSEFTETESEAPATTAKARPMTPTSTEAPCTDGLFESPRGETKDDVYRWVQEARCEPMAEHSRILADAILLTTRNGQSLRYPHEELRVYAEDGGLADTIQISAHVDIAWCAMLYGRASRVMTHLNSALLMGRSAATRDQAEAERQRHHVQ